MNEIVMKSHTGISKIVELTPATIAATFTSLAKAIEEKAGEIEALDAEATRQRVKYKQAYAQWFLTTQGANDVRRYTAEAATSDLLLNFEIAEQILRAAREQMKVLRDRLEIGRSMSAVMRMEWSNGNF